MKTLVGVFPSKAEAANVIHELEMSGIPSDDVLIAGSTYLKPGDEGRKDPGGSLRPAAALGTTGVGWLFAGLAPVIGRRSRSAAIMLGGSIGAGAGLIAGLILLAIPGVGALVAGSVAGTILVPMAFAAGAGGLVAGVYNMSVSHEMGPLEAEARRENGVVVAIHVDEQTESGAMRILAGHGARNLRSGENTWIASGSPRKPPEGEEIYPSDSSIKSHGEVHW